MSIFQATQYLFTYGTLRRHFQYPVYRRMTRYVTYVSKATTRGLLYDMGSYPALVHGPGLVIGELYTIRESEALWWLLDTYEEAGTRFPAPQEYRRERVLVNRPDQPQARPFAAWTYIYNWDVRRGRLIASGDYITYRRRFIDL